MAQTKHPSMPAAPAATPPHKAGEAAHPEPGAAHKPHERKPRERKHKESAETAAPDLVVPPAANPVPVVCIVPETERAAASGGERIEGDKAAAARDATRDALRARRWLLGISSLLSAEAGGLDDPAPAEAGDLIECGAGGAADDRVADGQPARDWRLPPPHVIAGVNDREAYLGMAAIPGCTTLRDPVLSEGTSRPRTRPGSRAECQRRCGADGFCDPSSEFGCGGEFCMPHGKP